MEVKKPTLSATFQRYVLADGFSRADARIRSDLWSFSDAVTQRITIR